MLRFPRLREAEQSAYPSRISVLIVLCYLILLILQEIRLAGTCCAIQNSKLRLSHTQRELAHYAMAEQLREDLQVLPKFKIQN